MRELKEAVDAAILAERKRLLPRFLAVRAGVGVALLGSMLVMRALGEPLASASLRGWWLALFAAGAVAALPRLLPKTLFWVRWANVVCDLPIAYVMLHDVLSVAGAQSAAVPLLYLALVAGLVASAGISMSRTLVWAVAAVGACFTIALMFEADLHGMFWPTMAIMSLAWLTFFAIAEIGRTERLALVFAREQRETALLNEELRRQLADRAGQLASAIARLSTTPRQLDVGMVIEDRYRVVRELGKGGMGAVYEVERIRDGARLALKVLTRIGDRAALARFAREAQIAATVDHPNLVSVLDVDVSTSGMLFLVMELVAGSSLAAHRERFGDRTWAVPILKQIADGLAALHARDIVHRDLKPANVLLDGDRAKIADFGIASLGPDPGDSTVTAGLTRTAAIVGTPRYMAPELAEGARAATPSSDVFALGVVAYELLSGRLPFDKPAVTDRAQPRPRTLDDDLGALVDRCLSLDPAARPAAEEIARALR